jgi:hypothetical protein
MTVVSNLSRAAWLRVGLYGYISLLSTVGVCFLTSCHGISPELFDKIQPGTAEAQVRELLGAPKEITEGKKIACLDPEQYFGPKPSKEYCALPDGAPIETWKYGGRKESWWVVFHAEELGKSVIDRGYRHRDIVY